MMISIECRFTGEVLFAGDYESVREAAEAAVAQGANLGDADLGDADLGGANLSYADLRGADLSGANLRDADLGDADLGDANLGYADLRGANLSGADLGGANLGGANLRDANLRDADLSYANLRGADLSGVLAMMGIRQDPDLPRKVLDQITAHPETWDQRAWHSKCGTRHCVAGWAVRLTPGGDDLEERVSTAMAATLLLWRPGAELPSFSANATDDETIGRLRRMCEPGDAGRPDEEGEPTYINTYAGIVPRGREE
ncbi:MAG TPA: pentapeptide repeat-containing protein [Polyangiaceae bacterium]